MTSWLNPDAKALMRGDDGAYSERFWARVLKTDGCWEWQGSRTPRGYGQCNIRRHPFRAHRIAYELTYGPIPTGLLVCHRCDNPPCVRPDHLFLGTTLDNVRDKIAKGRARNPLVEAARASTTCKNGHTWTEKTSYRYVRDGLLIRECRVCRYRRNRHYIMRKRATL